ERLRQVRAATAHLKERGQAARFTRVLDLMDLLPAAVQKPLGWLQVQASPINTVCTNVPGPLVSLYVQGKRLEKLVPVVPLTQGVGLAFAILSYADTLTIGITADPALVPNGESLCDLLQAGSDELRVLAGPARAAAAAAAAPPAGAFLACGCAGALVGWLVAGDLVTAESVIALEADGRAGERLPAAGAGLAAWAAGRGFRVHAGGLVASPV